MITPHVDEDVGRGSSLLLVGTQNGTKRAAVPEKLNINLPYDEAIPFLGIYPREEKAYVSTKTCSSKLKATKPGSVYRNQQLKE